MAWRIILSLGAHSSTELAAARVLPSRRIENSSAIPWSSGWYMTHVPLGSVQSAYDFAPNRLTLG